MNIAKTQIYSLLYCVILLLALLIWPLSAQSQTINYAKDGKVMANACLAFLSSGKSPASTLQSAGFRKNRFTKNVNSYVKGENPLRLGLGLRPQPIWMIFTIDFSKGRGPACYALFTLKPTRFGWDMAGLAVGDAFQAAFAAQGYKKTVTKKEETFWNVAREETLFVKSNSVYQFVSERIPLLRDDHYNIKGRSFRVVVTPSQ